MYLRTYSPYLDSFSLVVVNLRIQLELICWAFYSTVDCTCHRFCLTYIPSPLPDLTVFTHKVPSHPRAFPFGRVLINLLIGLILSALCSIVAFISMLLKSVIPVLGKNLAAKMSAFVV